MTPTTKQPIPDLHSIQPPRCPRDEKPLVPKAVAYDTMEANTLVELIEKIEKHFGVRLRRVDQYSPYFDVCGTTGKTIVQVRLFRPNNPEAKWQIGGWSWTPDLTP